VSLVHSQIPVTRLAIGDREAELLLQTLRSGWLIEGEQTRAFEAAVAAWTGARHAIATSSGTTALHLALLLAGIGPGDEVIVPSLSFIASANVVRHVGARPVFVDVRPDTLNLDERLIEASLSPRTRAILPVHQIGVPAEMDAIEAIAARHGLAVIEDAACALGSRYRGREIGSWSRLACLSFHPRKVITTGEGGMLLTADDALAERARRLVNHGEAGSALERHVAGASVGYNYVDVGYNYRLTNLQGALGVAQMERLPELLVRRRALAARYDAAFADLAGVRVPRLPAHLEPNSQSYLVWITPESRQPRDQLIQRLKERGISTRAGIMAIHREPAYAGWAAEGQLPWTERAADETLILPLYPQMTEQEQDAVIAAVREETT